MLGHVKVSYCMIGVPVLTDCVLLIGVALRIPWMNGVYTLWSWYTLST